jgi:cytochrome P450
MTPPRAKVSWLVRNVPRLYLNWITFFEELTREYGDIVYFELPGLSLCMINHPRYVESLLVTNHNSIVKSKNYRALSRMLGNGLIVSDGEFWRRQRRLVQPAFHAALLKRHIELMTAATDRMLDDWRPARILDAREEMMQVTLEIASDTLLGTAMKDQARRVTSALSALMNQYAGLGIYVVPPWIPTPNNMRARSNVRNIDNVIAEIVRGHVASDHGEDLLSILLSSRDEIGRPMPERELRDEIVTLFLAGHETTANAMAWTLYLLARHPSVEALLVSELRCVLGDRHPTSSDLPHLKYTLQVIKESMRLYPPVGGIGREAITGMKLGEYSVPAGTNIFISQWLMHRNPRFFEEPTAFKPERWTTEFERALPALAYLPFGGGPRLCIGAAFAMTEMTVLLAMIARRFRLSLVSEHEIKPVFSISLRPGEAMMMRVSAAP